MFTHNLFNFEANLVLYMDIDLAPSKLNVLILKSLDSNVVLLMLFVHSTLHPFITSHLFVVTK